MEYCADFSRRSVNSFIPSRVLNTPACDPESSLQEALPRRTRQTDEDPLPPRYAALPCSSHPYTMEEPSLVACERFRNSSGALPCMLEVSRRIRLVAPRSTPVLIEGPTGSGKSWLPRIAPVIEEKWQGVCSDQLCCNSRGSARGGTVRPHPRCFHRCGTGTCRPD